LKPGIGDGDGKPVPGGLREGHSIATKPSPLPSLHAGRLSSWFGIKFTQIRTI